MPFAMADAPPGDWDGLVILCGSVRWDGSRLGSNFLARALARHVPVLYVDPPVSIARSGGRRRGVVTLEQVDERLARVTPVAPPAKDRPGVLPVTNALFRWTLHHAARRLGGNVRAVISGPVKHNPFGVVGEGRRIFRVSDDFAAGGGLTPLSRDRLAAMERALAGAADAVVCASPVLVDKWRAEGYDPVLVPNGCDAEFLAGARADGTPRPGEVDLPAPVAGYLGQLSTRIDLDLLHRVAAAGHSLLLVGQRRADLAERDLHTLVDRPNVCWVDGRPFEELLPYLAAMDVGLVPYTLGEFNRASFPLKTLEYLAAGLPVVSTDLPATRWLDSADVHIAADADRFVDAIRAAAATSRRPDAVAARQRFAAGHSWDARATAYLDLL